MQKVKLTPEEIMNIASHYPEGFTVTMTGNSYTVGIAVATSLTQKAFGMEGVEKVIKTIEENGNDFNAIGGWYNTEDGQYYFDAVIVYDTAQMVEAYLMAIGEKQKAIYDIGRGIQIDLKYPETEAQPVPEQSKESILKAREDAAINALCGVISSLVEMNEAELSVNSITHCEDTLDYLAVRYFNLKPDGDRQVQIQEESDGQISFADALHECYARINNTQSALGY